MNWFDGNSMKANLGKYYVLLSGNDSSKITIENKAISSSKCEKHLEIKKEYNLNFKGHIKSLCKKQVKKLMLCLNLHHQ